MRRIVTAGLAAAAIALSTPASAQSSPEAGPPVHMPWSATCSSAGRSEPLDCAMQQRVVMAQTGQLLVALTIRVARADATPQLVAQVPFDLRLSEGLQILVGGASIGHMPFRTCNDGGCYAEAAVSEDMIAQLGANETVVVAVHDLAGRRIDVPVSLSGFPEAFERIR